MKRWITLLLIATAIFLAWLKVGFYETRFAEDNRRVFFLKKHPTLQIEFVNIFASDQDEKPLQKLSTKEQQQVIDYCRYRLGIDTQLQTQAELNICKQR